jgi:hypothetical protein
MFAFVVMHSRRFEAAVGLIIFVNCICIALEIHYSTGPCGLPSESGPPPILGILEHSFLVIYTLELIVKLVGGGCGCFTDRWFIFDFILVVMGTLQAWVLEPLQHYMYLLQTEAMDQIMVLRLFRLLRLLRAFRGMRKMRTSWRLVSGMLTSTNTMMSTLTLIIFMLFVFVCISIEFITKDQMLWKVEPEIMEYNFSSLGTTILFFFQFVTLDSVAGVYMPLILAKPALTPFFICIIMTLSIVLMNLVTAVIVEAALEQASEDKDIVRVQTRDTIQKLRPSVVKFFRSIDVDESGAVSPDDLATIYISDMPADLRPHLRVDSMEDLYQLLDADNTGCLNEQEFVEGILSLALDYTGKASIETNLMLKVLRQLTDVSNAMGIIHDLPLDALTSALPYGF